MKCLFIYHSASLDVTDPLGILCLIASVKQRGHDADLLITNLEQDLYRSVRKYNPDVIGFSVTSGSELYYLELIRRLRRHYSFLSVMGGPHPTFNPEILNEPEVDLICRGEGDCALPDLLDQMSQGLDYSNIPNLGVKKGEKIVLNPLRPLIADLDGLPFPDRTTLTKYFAYRNSSVKHFMASRGCPYNCTYCFNHQLKKLYNVETRTKLYCRLRSVDNVVREVEEVRSRYPLKVIYFNDDIFVMNQSWLQEFSEAYAKRVGLPMICYLRANLVTEEVGKLLKKAGCVTITMGIESGNETLRKNLLDRKMTNAQILNAAKIFHKYSISIMTQNMIGLPDETIDNAYETIDLNIKVKPKYAWVSIFQPYPGTKIHDYCLEKGLLDNTHRPHASYQVDSPINKGMIKREFENLHKLFALIVEFPRLRGTARRFIRWPSNPFFKLIYLLFKGYSNIFRLRMSSGEVGFLGYLIALFLYRLRRFRGKTY